MKGKLLGAILLVLAGFTVSLAKTDCVPGKIDVVVSSITSNEVTIGLFLPGDQKEQTNIWKLYIDKVSDDKKVAEGKFGNINNIKSLSVYNLETGIHNAIFVAYDIANGIQFSKFVKFEVTKTKTFENINNYVYLIFGALVGILASPLSQIIQYKMEIYKSRNNAIIEIKHELMYSISLIENIYKFDSPIVTDDLYKIEIICQKGSDKRIKYLKKKNDLLLIIKDIDGLITRKKNGYDVKNDLSSFDELRKKINSLT